MWAAVKRVFRMYFLTGLLVLGPLVISLYVIKLIIDAADSALETSRWFPVSIPGLGVVAAILIILISGFLAKNVLGRFIFLGVGDVIGRIPVVGTVYSSTRQVFETLLGSGHKQFGRVVLVNYPHQASWSLAFVTSEHPPREIQAAFTEQVLSVYIPTTPNPTSGFYIYVPISKTIDTKLSVEAAFKIIVSLGLAQAAPKPGKA